jgi:ubiquinone/menaquinone biosynthesis C-methylase UbiE
MRKVIDLLPETAENVLEVGIKSGELLNYYAFHPGYKKVTGIDISLSDELLALHPTQHIEIMDVRDIKFPDKTFDIVTCCQVIEHLETWNDVLKAISELRRVCKGCLVISVPMNETIPRQFDHYHSFDLNLVADLFPGSVVETVTFEPCPPKPFSGHIIIKEDRVDSI